MPRKSLRWSPLALALLAIPLTAPTCSGGGALHAFSANSIVIAMDACYQPNTNVARPAYCEGTAPASDDGVLKAYGLVYFLIKHGVAVYWVIDPNKSQLAGVDMTLVAPSGSEPVSHFDWSSGSASSFLQGATSIDFRGGPFVIDGVDHDRVVTLLETDPDFTQFKNAAAVDLYVASAPFQAPVAKTLAGTPPTLALLNITGGADKQNSVGVLTNYLTWSGLNFTGAGGTATGTHGAIYDALTTSDFLSNLPDGGSQLQANGYKLLWVPHWEAPNSYLTGSSGTQISAAQLTDILTNIGHFTDRGGNLFAECAGIGSIEGAFNWGSQNTVNSTYGGGAPASRALAAPDGGLRINSVTYPTAAPAPYTVRDVASPFMQIGDFPLAAESGAINDYGPRTSAPWVTYAQRLITDNNGADLFTLVPNKGNVASAGTVVYLGGHEYWADTGSDIAGIRLVLNTLFNLSATCVDPLTPCNTGMPGVCAEGELKCDQLGNVQCVQTVQASPETCDGKDNDCNGLIDDLPPQSCYDGPASAVFADGGGVGPCRPGSKTCVNGAWTSCNGEVLPGPEVCNGVDDDCNGTTDLLPDGGALTGACYDGPLGTENVGLCHDGTAVCDPSTGTFGACSGEQTPQPAQCSDAGLDYNCDGSPDACLCSSGDTRPCYSGPPGTANVGTCKPGLQTCQGGQWGGCVGEVDPAPESCDAGLDLNCNGVVGDGCAVCQNGDTRPCYDGPSGSLLADGGSIGVCQQGIEVCQNNLWGSCQQEVTPGTELCDGKDNDCDGTVDNGAVCPPTEGCINGTCVPTSCSGEIGGCVEGFACQSGQCVLANCGSTGAPCPVGQSCHNGACVDPCAGVTCGAGATCSGGSCVAGGCYDTGCGAGQVCLNGTCQADPCSGIVCPDGDLCSGGYCVPSCVFAHCQSGQVCDLNGQCVPAPCGGGCSASACQADGGCGADVCAGVGCASGQTCQDVNGVATCVADPCADVHCPVGTCVDGQCQRDAGGSSGSSGTTSTTSTTSGTTAGTSTGGTAAGTSSGTTTSGGSSGASGSSGGGTSGRTTGSANIGTKSGCGCGAASDLSPIWLMLGMLALLRRASLRKRGAALLLTGLVGLWGCGGTKATSSGGTSGTSGTSSGTTAGSGSTFGTTGAGTTSGTTATTGGTTGAACPSGQLLCGGACVDVLGSTDHCGTCTTRCAPDETCDQGYCAPTSPVNPVLTTVTPDHGAPGAQLSVALVGDRFDSQAVAHFTGGGASDVLLATTVQDAQHATATVDLTNLVAGPATLRMVNPGRIASNPAGFTIGGASAPSLTTLTPSSAPPGQDVTLDVAGTLFDSTTVLHASGNGVIDLVLPTTYVSSTELTAVFPLGPPDGGGQGLVPGPYQVFALNSGSAASNQLTFTVLSDTPVLTAVSPDNASVGAQLSLTATGDRFDPSTVLHFQLVDGGNDQALTTDFVRTDTVQVPVSSPLSLAGLSPGNYQVLAANEAGAKWSSPVAFTIDSNAPHVTSVSPSGGREGHTVAITVTGTAFDATSVIHFLYGSSDVTETTAFVSDTTLTTTLDLTSVPAGTASVAVFNSGGLASNAAPFSVESNQAVLTAISPQGALQGASLSATLTGSNFEQGAVVHFAGQGKSADLTPSSLTATQLQFSGFDLTTYPTGAYAVTVVNPNAQPSGPLSFTVQPGMPSLSSVSPNRVPMNTVQTFTLSGSLFAQSATVHVTGTGVDSSYTPDFVDTSTLRLTNMSLANVPAGTYQVSVVNPGPQESGKVNLVVTWPDGGP